MMALKPIVANQIFKNMPFLNTANINTSDNTAKHFSQRANKYN